MSTSLSPRSPGSSEHPTRQQLDELDALLARMLALPVNQANDEVTAEINALPRTAPALRQEPVSYRTLDADEPQTPVAEAKAPRRDAAHVSPAGEGKEDSDNWVPLSSTWKPSPHTWKPLAQSWQQPRATPAQESTPGGEVVVEASSPQPAPVLRPAAVEPPAAPVTVPKGNVSVSTPLPAADDAPPLATWVLPLLWFNIVFDVLLLPWGPPGRWLRRDGDGRSLLALIGGVLLVTAIGLSAMTWLGWTWDDLLARIP